MEEQMYDQLQQWIGLLKQYMHSIDAGDKSDELICAVIMDMGDMRMKLRQMKQPITKGDANEHINRCTSQSD